MSHGPPLRLRDDPSVARALRDDLVRAERDGPRYDVGAGLARFEQAIAASAITAAPASAPAAAPGAKTVLGAAMKGALLGVAFIGGAAVLDARSPSAAPPQVSVAVPARAAPSAAGVEVTHPSPAPPAPPAATSIIAAHAEGERSASSPSLVGAKSSAPPAIDPGPPPVSAAVPSSSDAPLAAQDVRDAGDAGDALTAEMDHLTRLRQVAGADPGRALALATEGQERFPSGIFGQEREAIAIAALARLGRAAEARARAAAFLSRYPRSSFAERIQEMIRERDAK